MLRMTAFDGRHLAKESRHLRVVLICGDAVIQESCVHFGAKALDTQAGRCSCHAHKVGRDLLAKDSIMASATDEGHSCAVCEG